MKKTFITSAIIAAVFGFGMDAEAGFGKRFEKGIHRLHHETDRHDHFSSMYKDTFKKTKDGKVMYDHGMMGGRNLTGYVDREGRFYMVPHGLDKVVDDRNKSPMEPLNNVPKVKPLKHLTRPGG